MLKPEGCAGCPFAVKGKATFVADHVPSHAKIFVVFDAPAGNFDGQSADETWNAQYFRRQAQLFTKLSDDEVAFMHMFRCKHAIGAKGKAGKDAALHCRQYDSIDNDSVLVTQGEKSWKFFSKNAGGRTEMRGYYASVDYDGTFGNPDLVDDRNDDDSTDEE